MSAAAGPMCNGKLKRRSCAAEQSVNQSRVDKINKNQQEKDCVEQKGGKKLGTVAILCFENNKHC